ncbi:hypothetical protein AB6A40_002397 [Gnathostoma spinigerum]|uniref:5-formyltetrahydrofolate cyclo-ligase n=1 Tax=Gnathostoma spinigerum TaxID=75299 RepID=A0ABD6EFJ8_9BILA
MSSTVRSEAKMAKRKEIAEILKTLSPTEIHRQSDAIFNKIIVSDWYINAKRISVYASTKGEVETGTIIADCLSKDKMIFIPHFTKGSNEMEMLRIRTLDEFKSLDTTLWGIPQHSKWSQEMRYEQQGALDLIIVPGMAFTAKGNRLGHGRGYYDRFLVEHKRIFGTYPMMVGLALKEQICDSIPTTTDDIDMNIVLYSD